MTKLLLFKTSSFAVVLLGLWMQVPLSIKTSWSGGGPVIWVGTFKVRACVGVVLLGRYWQFILLLLLEWARGRMLEPCSQLLQAPQKTTRLPSAPECMLIRSWTLRQRLIKYVVKHLQGKNWVGHFCLFLLPWYLGRYAWWVLAYLLWTVSLFA